MDHQKFVIQKKTTKMIHSHRNLFKT